MAILNELINNNSILIKPEYILARKIFWEYCKLINPKFFKDSRTYQVEMATTLQALYENRIIRLKPGDPWKVMSEEEIGELIVNQPEEEPLEYEICDKMMFNIPPRHGKSYMMTLFCQWLFGKSNENRIISVSYNDILSGRFSAGVRDGIDAEKIDDRFVIFSDVFPETRIKYGDASKGMWALEGQFFNYLGTGMSGTITGVGCRLGIIDDPVKNSIEAYNSTLLDNQFAWYTDTFLSRIEEGGKQIIVMTRWSTKDLCGKLLASEDADKWYVLKMAACIDKEKKTMLCPQLLSYKTYEEKRKLMSRDIADANYQQEPFDVKGSLYSSFKTYTELPKDEKGHLLFTIIKNYTDTADVGSDYLCSINYGVYDDEAYVLDVLYTREAMETTEPAQAEMMIKDEVNISNIESNNGGRGYARAVERELKDRQWNKIHIDWFHQSKNKKARILSNATWVTNHIYFPVNWADRWSDFHDAMTKYQKEGKNKHDDAPDAVTGIAENISGKKAWLY